MVFQHKNHSYDNRDRVTTVYLDADKDDTADTTESSVAYLYASGRLSGINTATTAYTISYDTFGNMVSVSAGGNVLATYTYTAGNGKLTRMTYGNGEYEEYTYDNLDRLVKVTYNGNSENAFTVLYDSNGRLAKAVDGKAGITYLYEYDSLDRLIRAYQKDANGNTIFAVENSYDEYGRAKGSTYVIDGTEYNYGISYKENTNLVSFYNLPGNSFGYSYDNFDRLTSKINPLYGYTYSYKNGTSLVSSLTIGTNCHGTSDVYSYTYDALGNIVAVRKDGVLMSEYEYDALGQLIREDDVVNSKAYVYEYDNAGNIQKTYTFDETGASASHWMDVYPALGEITETYTYSDSAWGDLLTNYNGTAISYDSIGNPTNWIGISSLSWSGRTLDRAVLQSEHYIDYTYNSDGIRTRKYEFNGNEQYLYDHSYVLDGSTIVKETIRYSSAFNGDSTTVLEYYYDESGVNSFRYNGTLYYYVKNMQGDVIGIMDGSGAVVVEYAYDAWGNILSVTGSLASTVGQINPFRYRGYYYDSETDLYYLNSRYYDAEVGRFINADGIVGANGGLQGYNMFAYCNNSPVMYVDPSGYTVAYDLDPLSDKTERGELLGPDGGGSGYYFSFGNATYSSVCNGGIFKGGGSFGYTSSGIKSSFYAGQNTAAYDEAYINSSYNYSDSNIVSKDCLENILSEAAKIANSSISGKGHRAGTLKHSLFTKLIDAYGYTNVKTEVSFLNGNLCSYGAKGSVRFDVIMVDANGEILYAWDFKTGSARLSPSRIKRMQNASGYTGDIYPIY